MYGISRLHKIIWDFTDASLRQLGAVIAQDNKPIAFFSHKLTQLQTKYTITELEFSSIIETLKEFRGMLWGQRKKVRTDHKNLIRDALGSTSTRVTQWIRLLEEYRPNSVFIKDDPNTVAGAISFLDYDPILTPDRNINYSL